MSQPSRFDNSYAVLGEPWCVPVDATPVVQPRWMAWNDTLADSLDWPQDWRPKPQDLQAQTADNNILAALAGNALLPGSQPVATVYSGHQFGSYNPRLGDGRALLLGEWLNATGERFDIQLKGAGPTPFSRGGDGRSPVGPVVREYLVSEAMHALGVPTTRALAAIATGDPVYRSYPEPGAVLTRVAHSHLRVGTVQYFAMSRNGDGLAELVAHATSRHYPEALAQARAQDPTTPAAKVLLQEAAKRLAALVARWQGLGFIHGVLNTDNMLLCGETVDYGPCAFLDTYRSDKVFSAIDTGGRYAYQNQPGIVHWNLSVLAQCLLPVLGDNKDQAIAFAQGVVDDFPGYFSDAHAVLLADKFGLTGFRNDDRTLVDAFFNHLQQEQLDFTLAFRWLTELASDNLQHTPLPELFQPSDTLQGWLDDWRAARRGREADISKMQCSNPVVIPRNHLVARAIAAAEAEDYSVLAALHERWKSPYSWMPGDEDLAASPAANEIVTRTFCGT